MSVLKKDAVTEALRAAIAEKGEEYVYPAWQEGCSYSTREGQPSCIVGWVVAALDPEVFKKVHEYEVDSGESTCVANLEKGTESSYEAEYYFGLEFEDSTLTEALQAAQDVQDTGGPWRVAQVAYDRVLAGEGRYSVVDELTRSFTE